MFCQMTNKHLKRCSASLIREMQIKARMIYHFIPLQDDCTFKMERKCWRGCGEVGNFVGCRGEHTVLPPLWKTLWWSLKTVNIELTNDLGILFLGRYAPKRIENKYLNKTCTQEYSQQHYSQQPKDKNNPVSISR